MKSINYTCDLCGFTSSNMTLFNRLFKKGSDFTLVQIKDPDIAEIHICSECTRSIVQYKTE